MKNYLMIAALAFMFNNAAKAQEVAANASMNDVAIDYTLKVSNHSVTRYLKLDADQQEKMEYICERLADDLRRVSYCKPEKRAERLRKSLSYNLSAARQVLDDEQYRKYIVVFNGTMKNKGLTTLLDAQYMAMAD